MRTNSALYNLPVDRMIKSLLRRYIKCYLIDTEHD